jgi:hypothetical protein
MPDFNPLPAFDRGHAALMALRDKVLNAFANPTQTLRNVGTGIQANHAAHQALDARAFADPRHPFKVTDQAALGELADNGLALLGPAPVGIFAGLASKALDPKALMEASSMARKGADPAEVWWKTGFGKGFDGQWRYEIDDSALHTRLRDVGDAYDSARTQKLDSASENLRGIPELFKAYPTLDTIAVNAGTISPKYIRHGNGNGYYSAGPAAENFKGGEIFGVAGSQGELDSIMRHELQHAVQRKQSWQGGANPEMFMPKPYLYGSQTAPQEMKAKAFGLYQRAAGEAEARLAQARGNMTADRRREHFPFDPGYFAGATGVSPQNLLSQPDIARILTQLQGLRP